jgi:hypothetical protein
MGRDRLREDGSMNSPRRSAALFVAFIVGTLLLTAVVIGWAAAREAFYVVEVEPHYRR